MASKKVFWFHKWFGLIAGIVIFVLSFSGAIIVFDDEIEYLIQRDVITQPNSSEVVSLDKAYATVHKIYPDWDLRFTLIPTKANRTIEAQVRKAEQRRELYIHPANGEILRDLDSDNTFSTWMLKFHYTLHSGFFGEVVILIAGFMFIISLITGFWFYRKAIFNVITFKTTFRFRNLRSGSSELHRSVGVWAILFNFIAALTGFIIIFIIVSAHVERGDKPITMPDPPLVEASLDLILKKAVQNHPGFDPSYIKMPSNKKAKIRLYGNMDSDLPIHYKFSNFVQFDPISGEETDASFIKDQPFEKHLLSFTYPLHFGDWGGLFIKILYAFFGLAPALLSITGFIMWQQRQRKKRKLLKSR